MLILWIVVPQMDIFDASLTGVEIPLRRGHFIDVAVPVILFLIVVLIQKLRKKSLKDRDGDVVVFSLLIGGLAWAGLQILF